MTTGRSRSERELLALEARLLDPAVRGSAEHLGALIADDFFEIGASGRFWSKREVLEALPGSQPPDGLTMVDPTVRALGTDHALVTYTLTSGDEATLRSSLWRREGDGWRMIFHQGTPVPPQRA